MVVRRTAAKKKSNSLRIDLSGVEGRVNFTEGDHLLEVMEVTQEEGTKAAYISWKFKATEDDESAGAIVYNNTSLSEQSLWNLRTLLEALGVEIPDSEMEIDLDELVGLQVMGTIEMETYEGKKRPRLADFWAAEEDVPEEKPTRAKRGAKAEVEEEKPLTHAQKRAAAKAAEEEPEEEKPSRAKRGSTAASKKKAEPEEAALTEDDINDMSEDELADVIEEHDLDVDLEKLKTLRKMRAAVVDAATEAGVLEGEEPEEEPEEEKPVRRRRAR